MEELSKKKFREKYLAPMEKEFKIEILYNGKEAIERGYGVRGYLGLAFTANKKGDKVLTLLWQKLNQDTLQTAFHEVGHLALHGKGSGFKGGKYLKEIEAELVAKRASELLGLEYRPYFAKDPKTKYIEYYEKMYKAICVQFGNEPKEPRHDKIEEVASRIAKLIK